MNSKLYPASILFSLFFLVFENINAQVPSWLWAKSGGGTGDDYCYAMTLDPAGSGDVYYTGSFGGTVDFDPGPGVFNLTGGGIFISKLDGSGNFEWAKGMEGYGSGRSITVDPSGSGAVYTTGFFTETVDFDPGAGVYNLTASSSDIFISKLDASGNFLWAKSMGGPGAINGFSIAIDPGSGDVYTTGNFSGTADFDPGTGTYNLTSAGVGDIFISKLNDDGDFVWAKALAGTAHDNAHSIAVDPNGDIHITGFFRNTVDFDRCSGTFNLTSAGEADIFILKLNSAGNFVWAKAMGSARGFDDGYYLTVDPAGNGDLYITGSFMGTVDFDPGSGTFNLTSAGGYDIFVSKLNGAGNFEWAISIGSSNADGGRTILLDPAGGGNVYTTGYFFGTVDFNPGEGEYNLTSTGSYDNFIAKWSSSGNLLWAMSVGGTSGESISSIALDGSGNICMGGSFQSDIIAFGSTSVVNANNSGYTNDFFVSRLVQSPLHVDLLSFNAKYNRNAGGVDLDWITATEVNNDFFTIERSRDGIIFQQILQVQGAGISTSVQHYVAFDPDPEAGNNYYRLRQTDYDGKTSISQVVTVNVNSETRKITVYPNPVTTDITIDFQNTEYSSVEITVSNMLGETVFTSIDQSIISKKTIDLNELGAGIYFLELNFDGSRSIYKILKQ